jgi:hypothetical protein
MIMYGLVFLMIMYGPSYFDLSLLELSVRGLHRRTKLPMSKSLFVTFRSLQILVSSGYFCRLVTVLSLF